VPAHFAFNFFSIENEEGRRIDEGGKVVENGEGSFAANKKQRYLIEYSNSLSVLKYMYSHHKFQCVWQKKFWG